MDQTQARLEHNASYRHTHLQQLAARWASPTVDQTQARLEHNASYRHTHLQQLATNRQRRLESEMAEESYTRFFFSAISIFLPYIYARAMFVSHAPWICQPLIRPPWHGGALSNGGSLPSQQKRERLVFIN